MLWEGGLVLKVRMEADADADAGAEMRCCTEPVGIARCSARFTGLNKLKRFINTKIFGMYSIIIFGLRAFWFSFDASAQSRLPS